MQAVTDEMVKNTPVYDPNKKYTWTPEDSFTLSGGEFGVVLNALRAILNTPESAKVLIANQANTVIEEVLSKAVEYGFGKEAPEELAQ